MPDPYWNDAWIQTFTGKQFWPLDPRPEDVCIEDIAHALSNKCRYGGHALRFYSVAEHSVLVARNVRPELRLKALLHDAPEAYSPFGDVPRPIKAFVSWVEPIEEKLAAAIAARFGLDNLEDPEVKRVDVAILHDEAARLMPNPPQPWRVPGEPLGLRELPCWPPFYAERVFLSEFKRLVQ